MSEKRICDYCKAMIEIADHTVTVDDQLTLDICEECFSSCIILSEQRRTRTRVRKPKLGRPKGKKTTSSSKGPSEIVDSGANGGAKTGISIYQDSEISLGLREA